MPDGTYRYKHIFVLCVYTKKGIESLEINSDADFWNNVHLKLEMFCKKHMFPKLVGKVQKEKKSKQ